MDYEGSSGYSGPSFIHLNPGKMMQTTTLDLGAQVTENGVTYTIWAPDHRSAVAAVQSPDGERRRIELSRNFDGYFTGVDPTGRAGDLYTYSLDGAPGIPDVASRFQPQGVTGPSQVVEANTFKWKSAKWERPAWCGHVVYELHVGTFTQEGTWARAVERLAHLKELGVTVVEVMPVAQWSGRWNWGYDGVFLFAPSRSYGTPDDFRAFVDACHVLGIAVMLDIVYNHIGPVGDYLGRSTRKFYNHDDESPWGSGYNFDGPDAAPVRNLVLQNIRYWLNDFHLDGFRMDATHAIKDDSDSHILREIAHIVHQAGGFIVAEDDRNSAAVLDEAENGGWHFDAAWADDFHHTARVSQTREKEAYFASYNGDASEIVDTLKNGWLFCGQYHPFSGRPRGTSCHHFPPEQFIYCISNHDQVGNRAEGERMHDLVTPEGYRALSLFLCLVPYTPMLFMGQEFAVRSPFLYFTDHPDDVGQAILKGRREEFKLAEDAPMPDPQEASTFTRSKLQWSDLDLEGNGKVLDLYKAGLKLRRELFDERNPGRDTWEVRADGNSVLLEYRLRGRHIQVYYFLQPTDFVMPPKSKCLLRTNDSQFHTGEPTRSPETLVFEL